MPAPGLTGHAPGRHAPGAKGAPRLRTTSDTAMQGRTQHWRRPHGSDESSAATRALCTRTHVGRARGGAGTPDTQRGPAAQPRTDSAR
eukprot:4717326-Pleurochrysis_carterae.AAC.1